MPKQEKRSSRKEKGGRSEKRHPRAKAYPLACHPCAINADCSQKQCSSNPEVVIDIICCCPKKCYIPCADYHSKKCQIITTNTKCNTVDPICDNDGDYDCVIDVCCNGEDGEKHCCKPDIPCCGDNNCGSTIKNSLVIINNNINNNGSNCKVSDIMPIDPSLFGLGESDGNCNHDLPTNLVIYNNNINNNGGKCGANCEPDALLPINLPGNDVMDNDNQQISITNNNQNYNQGCGCGCSCGCVCEDHTNNCECGCECDPGH